MIVGFRDEWLRAFFVDDVRSRNIPPKSRGSVGSASFR
jgi:plasmid maintenance system killer protein